MIAIALYGNEWLSAADASAHTALDSTNSTFQFVRRFSVELPGTHLPGAGRVRTANALFDWLRKAGTDRLSLVVRASSKKIRTPSLPRLLPRSATADSGLSLGRDVRTRVGQIDRRSRTATLLIRESGTLTSLESEWPDQWLSDPSGSAIRLQDCGPR